MFRNQKHSLDFFVENEGRLELQLWFFSENN